MLSRKFLLPPVFLLVIGVISALFVCNVCAYRTNERERAGHFLDDDNIFFGSHENFDSLKEGKEGKNTLQLVHVLFRHGDRTPDVATIYPTDPYADEEYFPFGKGQLTLKGKARAYRLGELLRNRYDGFLGRIYYPEILEARSSSYPRTRATLELVLGSLFVPTEDFKIRDNLLWQPIPYDYVDRNRDDLIATFISCPRIFDDVEDLQKSTRIQKELRQYGRLYDYLSQHSGWNVNSSSFVNMIHNTLQTESDWGFKLPKWTDKVWPEALKRAGNEFWKYYGSTTDLRKRAIGNLLKKILQDSVNKSIGEESLKNRKMYLYSGHDFNIIPMMASLGNPVYETPYTAHIMFELHKIEDDYFMKVLYNDYTTEKPKVLKVKYCDELCPLEKFVEMFHDHIPGDNWCQN